MNACKRCWNRVVDSSYQLEALRASFFQIHEYQLQINSEPEKFIFKFSALRDSEEYWISFETFLRKIYEGFGLSDKFQIKDSPNAQSVGDPTRLKRLSGIPSKVGAVARMLALCIPENLESELEDKAITELKVSQQKLQIFAAKISVVGSKVHVEIDIESVLSFRTPATPTYKNPDLQYRWFLQLQADLETDVLSLRVIPQSVLIYQEDKFLIEPGTSSLSRHPLFGYEDLQSPDFINRNVYKFLKPRMNQNLLIKREA